MSNEGNIDLTKNEVNLRTNVLRGIRWKLYLVSIIIILFIYYDLSIHFKLFDSGLTGIGFVSGISMQGITERVVRAFFFSMQLIFLIRFFWFSIIFIHTHIALHKYVKLAKQRDDQVHKFMENKYHPFGDSQKERKKMEQEEVANLAGSRRYNNFDRITKIVFAVYRIFNVIIFPTLVPLIVATLAICFLINDQCVLCFRETVCRVSENLCVLP